MACRRLALHIALTEVLPVSQHFRDRNIQSMLVVYPQYMQMTTQTCWPALCWPDAVVV